jgi:hypothetical protein
MTVRTHSRRPKLIMSASWDAGSEPEMTTVNGERLFLSEDGSHATDAWGQRYLRHYNEERVSWFVLTDWPRWRAGVRSE